MSRRLSPLYVPLAACGLVAATFAAHAQVPPPVLVVPDARVPPAEPTRLAKDVIWRFAASVGGTKTSGNSSSSTVNVTSEAVRLTDDSKLNLAVRGIYAEQNDRRTGANIAFSAQHDQDFSRDWFGFGKFDVLRDHPANIHQRQSAYAGVGYHLIRVVDHSWDVSGGLGYTDDKYVRPTQVAGGLRQEYGRVEGVISEASTHRVTENTSIRQKIGVFPNLKNNGEYRVVFDAGLSVAMNATLSLTAGVTYRHDSDPGIGFKKGDAVYVTGIGVKFD